MQLTLAYLLPAQLPEAAGLARLRRSWTPLGSAPVQRFAAAYAKNPPGVDHRLMVVINGEGDGTPTALRSLEYVAFELTKLPRPLIDVEAYRQLLARVETDYVCFLNANAAPAAPNWLKVLLDAVRAPGVGLAGSTASYEQVVPRLPLLARRWPEFPNPHVRSNAFVAPRTLLQSVTWPAVRNKLDALRFESGRASLTRQVLSRGLKTVVVGRDGRFSEPDGWFESSTFRSGEQSRLLVTDNRTREWDDADAQTRAALTRLAWGEDPTESAERVHRNLPVLMGRL